MMSLWIRIGDGGDYEAHGDDLHAVVDQLNAHAAGEPVAWRHGGLETVNYRGNNYISLYYGDRAGNFVTDLDNAERKFVEKGLEPCFTKN